MSSQKLSIPPILKETDNKGDSMYMTGEYDEEGSLTVSLPEEEFRWVVGYEGLYAVSNYGYVYSVPREGIRTDGNKFSVKGRFLKQIHYENHPDRRLPYPCVGLNKVGQNAKLIPVHRLVAESYLGPRPEGYDTCHNDGSKDNAALQNLRYDTKKNNHADMVLHGTRLNGENNPWSIHTNETVLEVKRLLRDHPELPYSQIEAMTGCSRATVGQIRSGNQWSTVVLEDDRIVARKIDNNQAYTVDQIKAVKRLLAQDDRPSFPVIEATTGVKRNTISMIHQNLQWKHVTLDD